MKNTNDLNEKNENEINNFKIYAHINKINGKIYIGQTKRTPYERFGNNGIQYKPQIFYRAIQKYGWNNFEHVILFDNLSSEMANIIETELIKKYKTTDSNFGYNILPGGNGVADKNYVYTGKIHKIVMMDKNFNILKEYPSISSARSEHSTINMNYRFKPYYINDNFIFVFKSQYENIINSKKFYEDIKYYKVARRRKPVICLNNLKVFGTTKEAGEYANVSQTMITECCQGKRSSAGKKDEYGSLMWDYYDESKIYSIKQYIDPRKKRCLCTTTNEIFDSVLEASNKYDISTYSLYNACENNSYDSNTHGGNSNYKILTWKYI